MKTNHFKLFSNVSAGLTALAIAVIFLTASFLISGCQKKQEQPQQQTTTRTDTTAGKAADTTKAADTAGKAATNANVPDLKGTWNGKMGAFRTTLKITEQTQNEFKGSISMAFRDPINQKVSGKFDSEKGTLTMRDVLKLRYQGRYNGKISGGDRLSGTYTLADGQKFNFNLSKK